MKKNHICNHPVWELLMFSSMNSTKRGHKRLNKWFTAEKRNACHGRRRVAEAKARALGV